MTALPQARSRDHDEASAARGRVLGGRSLATCHKAVSAEASCWNQVIKGIEKGVKVGCKAQGPDEAECLAVLGAELGVAELSLEQAELDGREACAVGADTFYFFCQNPF